jgi:hypothetical protein
MGVSQEAPCRPLGLFGVPLSKGFKAVLQDAPESLTDDVTGDEGGRVKRPFLLTAARVLFPVESFRQPLKLVPDPLQVRDGLLEDVAKDIDVDQLGHAFGSLVGGSVFVGREFLKVPTDVIGHVQTIKPRGVR